MHEGAEVTAVGRHIVEAVGSEFGIPEAPQIRRNHLKGSLRERPDVPPKDSLGLRPAVDEQERQATRALVHEGLLEAARSCTFDREAVRTQVVLLRHPGPLTGAPAPRAARPSLSTIWSSRVARSSVSGSRRKNAAARTGQSVITQPAHSLGRQGSKCTITSPARPAAAKSWSVTSSSIWWSRSAS